MLAVAVAIEVPSQVVLPVAGISSSAYSALTLPDSVRLLVVDPFWLTGAETLVHFAQ